jgi:hypothetical protein
MTPALWNKAKAALQQAAATLDGPVRIAGGGSKASWCDPLPPGAKEWRLPKFPEPLIFFSPDDQVVAAWGSTPISLLLEIVEEKGLTLPIPRTGHPLLDGVPGTVGGWCAMNFPHALWSQRFAPREAVLGMGIMLGDGRVAKCGAGVVKSVAGYDVHRLFSGSRGALGVVGMAILRLTPLRALPSPEAWATRAWKGEPVWIQRVLRSDWSKAASKTEDLIAADPSACLLWRLSPPPRFENDWVIGPGGLLDPPSLTPSALAKLKASFDPSQVWI